MTSLLPPKYANDLLTRFADIEKAIDGIKGSSKRWWNPELNGPMPQFVNRISGIRKAPSPGANLRSFIISVDARLLAGSVGAGYKHQNEDALNDLYFLIINTFEESPKLYHPETGEAMRFVQSISVTGSGGTVGFQFSEGSAPVFGSDFTVDVTISYQVRRKV